MRKRLTLRSVQSRGHSGFAKMMTIVALLLCVSTGAWAQTTTEVSTFAALKSALSSGNNVKLTSDITCTEEITITNVKVKINGNGKKLTGSSCRAFTVNSSAVLCMKDVTVTGFDLNAGGGAFLNSGTLVLDGCTISNNHTTGGGYGGGAIENKGSGAKLYATNTTFRGNYSGEIGGAINNYRGSLYLTGCMFDNNYTTSSNANYGGAIGVNGGNEIRIINCEFSGNKYNTNGGASDLGIYSNPSNYTIAGCTGITVKSSSTLTTYNYGAATLNYSDLSAISFTYDQSDTPIAPPAVPKHLITATYDKQTRSLEQPLPYATTVGELYEAVTGEPFSSLISTMTALENPLSGISSNNTDVVSIGEFNGASTTVTVKADGKAAVAVIFGSYAQGIFVSVTPPLYVTMKDGVKDADKWTVKVGDGAAQALPIGGLKGDGSETVTLQYSGRLKVKSVKATSDAGAPAAGNSVDLSTLTADYEAQNGDVLTGTLANNVKISIADGATVTLDGVTINGVNDYNYSWAGITCLGDATIILTGENTVKGFYQFYPGIYVPENKTVTIQGIGSLTASSSDISGVSGAGIGSGYQLACGNITIMGGSITALGSSGAAGIGSGNNGSCGNITITGGTINASANTGAAGIGSGSNGSLCGDITITGGDITATGGSNAAGIGSGNSTSCGNITITGGNITATGTDQAAGIGSGYATKNKTASCGTITITNGVTSVTATKGNNTVPNSIGVGKTANNATNTCGTVTIGCTLDASGNPVGGTTGAISESPYTYQPSN